MPTLSAIDTFNIGYIIKRSQAKQWITTNQDLDSMYAQSSEDISLWCDQRIDESMISASAKKKRSSDPDKTPPAKRNMKTNYAEREDAIEEMTTELNAIHGDQYSYPQYKLWARLITCGQHADKENAPNVPMITGSYSKERKQKDSSSNLGDVIAGAAVAIVKALKELPDKNAPSGGTVVAVSPGKRAALSGQYLKQLEAIQKLKDEGVLTITEFQAQKQRIMANLQSLC